MHQLLWTVSSNILNVVMIIMSQYFRCISATVHQCSDLIPDICNASLPFKSGHGSDDKKDGGGGILSDILSIPHFLQNVKEKLSVLSLDHDHNNNHHDGDGDVDYDNGNGNDDGDGEDDYNNKNDDDDDDSSGDVDVGVGDAADVEDADDDEDADADLDGTGDIKVS